MLRNTVKTQEPTPYEVLGVVRNATLDEIKNAYRALAKVHHPDKDGDADNFAKICNAYEFLTGGSKATIETLHIPIEAFDAFNTAIDNCDLATLDQLYARFPITFSEDYVVKALTHFSKALHDNSKPNLDDTSEFQRHYQQRDYTIEDRVNTLLWLLNHDAEGNISIRIPVTLTQRDRIDTV
jgi:curved DNA-binding protein CbpA